MANYYFMAVSTFMIAALVTIVTVKWVEPRLGPYTGDLPREEMAQPTPLERKGLKRAGYVCLAWIALILAGLLPENGILRGTTVLYDGTIEYSLLATPILRGFITVLFLIGISAGVVYGFTVGTYKQAKDVVGGMNDSIKTLASYLVLVFFCAQFVAWFDWSNLGLLLAINGANFLQEVNLHWIPLFILFILLTGFINLFMGSASAKWAIMGPIFIPIFMLLGYSPELSQAVFRVGDSFTNIITPMMAYFALVIVYFQKYDKKAGIGTIMGNMIPYSITFFIAWVGLLIAFVLLGIPLGPGVSLHL
jgi:aminobenzoyl-glutamate transport protein